MTLYEYTRMSSCPGAQNNLNRPLQYVNILGGSRMRTEKGHDWLDHGQSGHDDADYWMSTRVLKRDS